MYCFIFLSYIDIIFNLIIGYDNILSIVCIEFTEGGLSLDP